ncbi:hypothetical protein M378DRAFT_168659, partial [Amanita muscaria Koide BX008]
MSASASNPPSKSTTRGSSHKRKKSEEVDNQRKRPSTVSRPQSVDRFTHEIRDVQSREAGDGGDPGISIDSPLPSHWVSLITSEPPLMNSGNGDTVDRLDPEPPIPTEASTVTTETRSVTLFQGSSNLQISNTKFTTIGGDATIIQFGDGQFTEVQRNLICDYIATLAALPDMNNNLKKWHVLTQFIILLPRAEAVFNDYQTKKKSGPCFDGTRVALLREMTNWVTCQDESRMYILSGLAGIGKSTVAYTIASRAADLNLLGASFFFSRDEADRNNAKKLFTTIAYQLCVYNETFAKAIGDVLLTERGYAATTKDPQDQLQVLILDPLRSIVQSRARPILVIVDALDECDEDDVSAVVEGLSQLVRDLPSFKVILTTRPLPYLDYFLGNQTQGSHKLFHLQDIESKVVDGDIRLYLKHNLSLEKVRERYPRRQWYASDEQIDALVRAAGRLFIIASTAVRYILDKSASNPAAQVQKLLRACAQDHTPFKDLDHFYSVVLRNIVPVNCDDDDVVSRYQSVVGAIVFASHPLPVSTLAHFIDMDAEDIHAVLEKLQSVILLGDDDVPRIYHKSFPDYLTDQVRCKDPCLRIDPKIGHTQIATCCFKITNKHLKYNILGLGEVARYMSNEDGLKKDGITDIQLQEKIPQHLRYASVYWANHLEVANIQDTDLMNELENFVDVHTLHWFEALSLIGNLDTAHRAIRVVLKLLKSTSSDLHPLLSDALRFISKFYTVINRSALHTYYSALPFSPTDSLSLYRRYIREAEHNILCGIEGGLEKWDALVANLNHGDWIDVIKFSLSSTLFVSYSEEYFDGLIYKPGKLKIWDAATGTPISTIPGQTFAVTNDFSTVTSSSDNIITFYNVNGSARGTVLTTPSKIQKLALSESCRVAAALSDGTVWLWDSRNAELIGSFDGFEGEGALLEFSPTGARLAYSSLNGIVTLRDGISGRLIADLQCGSGNKFVFSGDGSRIASVADYYGLLLWNTESGGLVGAVRDVGRGGLAISANGSLLATAYPDNVMLWSENYDHLAKIKVLGLKDTRSMVFSLDNTLAIGIPYYDRINLYNTDTHSFISTLWFSGVPTALAFNSPDCTHLVAGGKAGNVCLWDMRGIDTSSPPSTVVTSMTLSRNCSRLACGLMDGTVELWETIPTKRRIASLQPEVDGTVFGFTPDGRLFASGVSFNGTIKLWNAGDGSLHGTLKASPGLEAVALSNSMLVAAGIDDVTLWILDTLSLIHTWQKSGGQTVSISDDSDLAAIFFRLFGRNSVVLFDVVNRTTIATFTVSSNLHKLTFLPDKSQL